MQSFKTSVKIFRAKSPVEKNIIKLLCCVSCMPPSDQVIHPILKDLNDVESSNKSSMNIRIFIEKLHSVKTWEECAKLLLVVNKALLDNEHKTFIYEFSKTNAQNIMNLTLHKEELKEYVKCGLMKYYYRYLIKHCEFYHALQKCKKYVAKDYTTHLQSGDSQFLECFVQVKNLLNFAVKIQDFYSSSVEILEIPITQEIGGIVLRSCIDDFNLLSRFLNETMEFIFNLSEEMALMLDDIYSEVIHLVKPIESFYQFKSSLIWVPNINEPQGYKLDKEFNKKEELFINVIKKKRREVMKEASLNNPAPKKIHAFEIEEPEKKPQFKKSKSKQLLADEKPAHNKSYAPLLESRKAAYINSEHEVLLTQGANGQLSDEEDDRFKGTYNDYSLSIDNDPFNTRSLSSVVLRPKKGDKVKTSEFNKVGDFDF